MYIYTKIDKYIYIHVGSIKTSVYILSYTCTQAALTRKHDSAGAFFSIFEIIVNAVLIIVKVFTFFFFCYLKFHDFNFSLDITLFLNFISCGNFSLINQQ